MMLSEVIAKLSDDLATRGDCKVVARSNQGYVVVEACEVYRTPYKSPIPDAAFIELIPSEE